MYKRLTILAAIALLAGGLALATEPPQDATAPPAEEPSSCNSKPVKLSELSAEELAAFEREHNLTVRFDAVGGLPACPNDPRRCANSQGGCAPTGSCNLTNTGLTGCEASDGATIECKYGQTVHERTCVCENPSTVCFGTDLRLVCN